MVAMFPEMIFNQFKKFSGYARFDITAERWIDPYNVPRSISFWLKLLMFLLLELNFLLITIVF